MPSALSGNIIPLTPTLVLKPATVTQSNVNANGQGAEYPIDAGIDRLTITVIGTGGILTIATVTVEEFWLDTQTWETGLLRSLASTTGALSLSALVTLNRARYEYIPPAGVTKIRTPVSGIIVGGRTTVSILEKRHPGA